MAKSGIDSETLLNIQKRVESIPPTALAQELQRNAQMLVQQPDNVLLQFGVGLLYGRIGDYQSAATVLERSLKLSKNHPIILGVLAFLYSNQIGDQQNAIKFLKKKLQADKRDSASYLLIAKSYLQLGKPEKALEYFNKLDSFARGQNKHRLLAMRSQCHQRMGNIELARNDLLAFAESDPAGLISVADVLSRLPDNPAELTTELLSIMTEALNTENNPFRDDLHKALTAASVANMYEIDRDYCKAFEYFAMANEIQGASSDVWGHRETSEFEIYKSVFDTNIFEQFPKGHPSDKQIFIIGMPRSGTTLLESILAAHGNVEDHGELEFFLQQQHRLGFTSEQNPNTKARSELLRRRITSAPEDGFKNIADAYMSRYGFSAKPKTFHVDKMPHNFRALGIIAASLPNAKVIHARRHPMDICLSNYKNLLQGYNATFGRDLEQLGHFYLEYAELMRHWEKVLPITIHKVKYEDLVTNTQSHAKSLVEFCGITWDESSLGKRKLKSDAHTASMWQVRQDIYSTSVQKWRNYEKQLSPLAEILKDEISRYEQGD